MKPIILRISAFGPFKEEVVIDFKKINSSKIFLITGDTGSGKTSIFDAICYCLYNDTSGTNRSIDSLRSDYASKDTDTFVELVFSHKNKEYTVYRSPSYLKQGRKTKTMSVATLKYDDVFIEGTKPVTEKINEIMGIDVKQFKQISMLAQGEFLKLLLATSDERSKIFRKIFDTSIYNKVSDELKNRFLSVKKTYDESKIRLDNEISHIKWDIDTTDMLTNEILDCLDILIKNDSLVVDSIKNENEELEKKIVKLNSLITLQNIDNDNITKLKKLELDFNNLKSKKNYFDEIKKDIDINKILIPINNNIKKISTSIDNTRKKIDSIDINSIDLKIKKSKLEYDTIDDLNKELNEYYVIKDKLIENEKINKDIKANELFLNENNVDDIIPLEEKINSLKEEIENDNSPILLERAKDDFKKNELDIKDCNGKLKEIDKLEKELKSIDVETTIKEYNDCNKKYSDAEASFLLNQAGILASTLRDSEPCMVCGSKVHPNVAVMSSNAVSKEELDILKSELNVRSIKRDSVLNRVSIIKTSLKEKNKDAIILKLNDLMNKNFNIKELESKVLYINKIKKEYSNSIKRLEYLRDITNTINIKKAYIEVLKNSLFKCDYSISVIEDKINITKNNISSITDNYNKLLKSREVMIKELDMYNDSLESMSLELNNLNAEFNKIDYKKDLLELDICNKLESDYYTFYDDYNRLLTLINDLRNRTKGKTYIDTFKLLDEVNTYSDKIKSNNNNEILLRLNNNKEIYNNINSLYKSSIEILKNYSLYKKLSDTANGTISGKSKILFEQYVQATYFDEIIKNSNYRLDIMTSGRYELLRKVDNSNLKDKVGLDLSIMDNYTGKIRDIKSLSGGESFKASLSLALGLSDTIQNYAGGIIIDTMFIDEGFGSLDNDSLEQSLKTLSDLTNSNCIIGIISHVNELKQRIDKKIIVSKSNTGSRIRVEA